MMDKIKSLFTDLKDSTAEFTKEEIDAGKLMAILSYLGILCLIPYFAEKDNKYVRYHAIQGLNLFIIDLICSAVIAVVGVVATILFLIPILGWILGGLLYLVIFLIPVGIFALSIWGLVLVFQDQAKELPICNKVKIIKQ